MRPNLLLPYFLIFLSGVAGLGYEMVWTRMFSTTLGHEVVAVLAVVAAFFSGLALGSWVLDRPIGTSRRPDIWYAGLEGGIGLWSLLIGLTFPWIGSLLLAFMGADPPAWRHWTVAFLFPFLALLPATFAMGGTLPAMTRLLALLRQGRGHIGGLYAANTLGAVAGTLLTTLWIAPILGFRATAATLAVLNLLCMVVGLKMTPPALSPINLRLSPSTIPFSKRLLVSLFVTGFLGIGYEVLMTRALSQILENTVFSFAALLAVYLFGTAIGGAIYQFWSPQAGFRPITDALAKMLSLACLAGTAVLPHIETLHRNIRGAVESTIVSAFAAEMAMAATVFFVPTLLMGMLFSHLAQGNCGLKGGVGKAVAVNTLGASVAPWAVGVLLLPAIGIKACLLAMAGGYLFIVALPTTPKRWLTFLFPVAACLVLAKLPLPLPGLSAGPGERLLALKEGVMATVSVVGDAEGQLHLKVNNHYQMGGTSSAYSDQRQAHIPLLLHPHPRRALFLGLGTGATFAASADHPGLQATCVELVPELLDVLPYFTRVNGQLRDQPNLVLRVADARRYLQTDPARYDVIVADLFHPSRDGAGFLYTREHFQAIRTHLAPDGIFCQWLPLYQMDLDLLKTISRTFLHVFPDSTLFVAHFSLGNPIIGLVGGFRPLPAREDWFAQRVGYGNLRQRLESLHLNNIFDLLGCYLGDTDALARFSGRGPINTDDRPVILFKAPKFVYGRQPSPSSRLLFLVEQITGQPSKVLQAAPAPTGKTMYTRLGHYWNARDLFLHAGEGVPKTRNLLQLLAYVRPPLFEALRISPDFDPAFRPLLAMSRDLIRVNPRAGAELLRELVAVAPNHPYTPRLQRMIDEIIQHSPPFN